MIAENKLRSKCNFTLFFHKDERVKEDSFTPFHSCNRDRKFNLGLNVQLYSKTYCTLFFRSSIIGFAKK